MKSRFIRGASLRGRGRRLAALCCAAAFTAAAFLSGARSVAQAAAGDCTVSCAAPLYDDGAKQWYVVVTNGCDSTAHVDVRNNGATYGIDCAANSDSPKQYVGRKLGDDFKVLKIKLVN